MAVLDKSEDIATTIGLIASGIIFAAGVAGLLYVILHVTTTDPPSFGSQGEWLWGGLAALLVAGWGFGQASTLYAKRRRTASTSGWDGMPLPKIQFRSDGLRIDVSPNGHPDPGANRSTFTWSWNSAPIPLKTLVLTEAQAAAADAEAGDDGDWHTVCEKVVAGYGSFSEIEQDLYRRAVKAAVDVRRGKTPTDS